MIETRNFYPAECRLCRRNCFECRKQKNGYRLAEIRGLAAKRALKMKELARLQREIGQIEGTIMTALEQMEDCG